MDKEYKNKKITFRLSAADLERLEQDAKAVGFEGISTYIRKRLEGKTDRVFYDPEMTSEVRAYRSEIRSLVKDVERVRRHIDSSNEADNESLREIRATINSIYRKMDSLEYVLSECKKGMIEHGNYQTAAN